MRETMRDDGVAVRQLPWVTFALLVLFLSSFAYLRVERSRVDAELGSSLAEAGDYFRAHPYLSPPPLLESQVGAPQAEQLRASFLAARCRSPGAFNAESRNGSMISWPRQQVALRSTRHNAGACVPENPGR